MILFCSACYATRKHLSMQRTMRRTSRARAWKTTFMRVLRNPSRARCWMRQLGVYIERCVTAEHMARVRPRALISNRGVQIGMNDDASINGALCFPYRNSINPVAEFSCENCAFALLNVTYINYYYYATNYSLLFSNEYVAHCCKMQHNFLGSLSLLQNLATTRY